MTFIIGKTRIKWNPLQSLLTITILFYLSILLYILLTISAFPCQSGGEYYKQVTVAEGDTLWTIACRYLPNQDPRLTVAQLREVNQLTDPTIYPGQILAVPK